MKKLFGIVIFFLCFQISSGQNISIIFYSPQQNAHALQFVTDSLFVQVAVISNYPLTTVTTNASGRQISLVFNPVSGYYEGSMPMAGLTQGTLTAQVTATDNQGNQQMASQAFIYDIPAVLIVTAPLS